jgi:hypothetical protein
MYRALIWSLVFFGIVFIFVLIGLKTTQPKKIITDYHSCIKAVDSRIQESYPAICITKDGDRYIQPLKNANKTSPPQNTPTPPKPSSTPTLTRASSCVVSGCNSEICADKDLFSPCIEKPEFACYQNALCEIQENGSCGWTMTDTLESCLSGFGITNQ